MSYSYSFCLNRAADIKVSNYSNLDWKKAKEFSYESLYVTRIPDGIYTYDDIAFNFKYNTDSNFQYFTSMQFVHDGTLLFISLGVQ